MHRFVIIALTLLTVPTRALADSVDVVVDAMRPEGAVRLPRKGPFCLLPTSPDHLGETCADAARLKDVPLARRNEACHPVTLDWTARRLGEESYEKTLTLRVYAKQGRTVLHEIHATHLSDHEGLGDVTAAATCRAAFTHFGKERRGKVYEADTDLPRTPKADEGPLAAPEAAGPRKVDGGKSRRFFLEGGLNVGGPTVAAGLTLVTGLFGGGYVWNAGGMAAVGYYPGNDPGGMAIIVASHYAIYGSGSYSEHFKQRYATYSIGIRQYLPGSDVYLEVGFGRAYSRMTHGGSSYQPYASEDDPGQSFHRCETSTALGVTTALGFDVGSLGKSDAFGLRFEPLAVFVPVRGSARVRSCDPRRGDDEVGKGLGGPQIVGLTQLVVVFAP